VLLVDADPVIVGVWDYLMRVRPEEVLALPDLPNAGDSVDDHPLPQEARWLIGFWLNRGSASPKRTRTAFSARSDRGQLNWGARAKARIAAQLPGLAGWSVRLGSYDVAPDEEATWFVDPPYVLKGSYYRVGFDGHEALGAWCRTRRGIVIACEGPGAAWLPFETLGSFKSTRGRAEERVWVKGVA